MRVDSDFESLNALSGSLEGNSRPCDLFVGLENVISSAKHPDGLFKTQSNYLRSLRLPDSLQHKVVGPSVSRYICFNQNDTKSVLYFPDSDSIYDPEPHWLKMLPRACTAFSDNVTQTFMDAEFIYSRASMSFAHFLSGELGSLLALDALVSNDVPIYMPFAKPWHLALIKFFGINREVCTSQTSLRPGLIQDVKISKLHLLAHLEEYQGLCISRYKAQTILARKFISPTTHFDRERVPSRILWLTRNAYESSNHLPARMVNFLEAKNSLASQFNIDYCNPEDLDINVIASRVYNSSIVICESGSLFMNYLLFASRSTKIIQLTPQYCLGPTWSFYNINNMQWFFPVLSHLHFLVGRNAQQTDRQYGSPWNVPSVYNVAELSSMITRLMKAC